MNTIKNRNMALGFTRHELLCQHLTYLDKLPTITMRDTEYLSEVLIPHILKGTYLEDDAYSFNYNFDSSLCNIEESGWFIICLNDRFFKLVFDFRVGEPIHNLTGASFGIHYADGEITSCKELDIDLRAYGENASMYDIGIGLSAANPQQSETTYIAVLPILEL